MCVHGIVSSAADLCRTVLPVSHVSTILKSGHMCARTIMLFRGSTHILSEILSLVSYHAHSLGSLYDPHATRTRTRARRSTLTRKNIDAWMRVIHTLLSLTTVLFTFSRLLLFEATTLKGAALLLLPCSLCARLLAADTAFFVGEFSLLLLVSLEDATAAAGNSHDVSFVLMLAK